MRLEECAGVLVSRAEVLRELRKHDVRSAERIAEFDLECPPTHVGNPDGEYDAGAVLAWLGY